VGIFFGSASRGFAACASGTSPAIRFEKIPSQDSQLDEMFAISGSPLYEKSPIIRFFPDRESGT